MSHTNQMLHMVSGVTERLKRKELRETVHLICKRLLSLNQKVCTSTSVMDMEVQDKQCVSKPCNLSQREMKGFQGQESPSSPSLKEMVEKFKI